jgi:hypothetical protein
MPDFTVHTLLTTPLIEVRDVLCAGTCRHKGAVERTGRTQLEPLPQTAASANPGLQRPLDWPPRVA